MYLIEIIQRLTHSIDKAFCQIQEININCIKEPWIENIEIEMNLKKVFV